MPRRRLYLFLASVLLVGGFLILEAKDNAIVYAEETPSSNIQITEIMYDLSGSDSNREWVELKNTGAETVEIIGGSGAGSWRFFDGSNHYFSTSTVLSAEEYLVVVQDANVFLTNHSGFGGKIVESSFSLNNTSAGLALRINSDGAKWSEINYLNSWGAAGNGKTLEKKNLTGDNSASNWQESAVEGGTPGADNSAGASPPSNPPENPPPASPSPPSVPSSDESSSSFSCVNTVLINELLINPEDSNADYEFIELYNPLGQEVVLAGWTLQDTQGKVSKYLFPQEAKIPALGYLALYRPQIKITLNNSGDGARLMGTHAELCDTSPPNSGLAKEDMSFARQEDDRWLWTSVSTPGAKNVFQDQGAIASSGAPAANSSSESTGPAPDLKGLVVINELLPNPAGADKEEFIELKNLSGREMNLGKWWLEDASRQKHIFSSSTVLAKDGFLLLWKQKSGLSLNNKGETVKLFGPEHQLVDEVVYEEPAEDNFSYSRLSATGTVWQWSKVMTPGATNVIQLPNRPPIIIFELPNTAEVGEEIVFDASDTADPEGDALSFLWDFGDGGQSVQEMATHTFQKAGRRKIVLKVNDHQGNEVEQKGSLTVLKEEETEPAMDSKGSTKSKSSQKSSGKEQRRVVGLVTVPPGLFASQTFYLQDLDNETGLQIYMFKKDFPNLKVGDKVAVAGEVSELQNETRLKIKKKGDIKFLAAGVAVEPAESDAADLSEEQRGSLIKLQGEVLEPKSGQFYLSDDSGEVMIQFKPRSGLKGRLVKEGDTVEVVGILGQSKGEWRVWPRFLEDIKITGFNEKEAAGLAEQNEKKTAKKYLTVTAGGLTSLLLALFAKSRGAAAKGLALGLISRVSFWKRKNKIDRNGTL